MWIYLALMAAILHSLTQAIYLEPCQSDPRSDDRYVDIVRGQDSTTLYCRGLNRRHTVTWTVAGKRVGRCPNPTPSPLGRKINSCHHKDFRPAINPVRSSTYYSTLTIHHAGMASWSLAESDRVVCSTDYSHMASCLINYVSASPRGVQLQTNGVHRPQLTLKEGKAIRWRCQITGSWPVNTTTLTLTRDEGSSPGDTVKVKTGSGDLEHRVKGAQCGQAGRYVCRAASYVEAARSLADFCWLYVLCRPRLVDPLRPVLLLHHSPSSVRFDVIAYPLPRDVTVTFVGQASGGEEEEEDGEEGEGREGALTARCEQGEAIHLASCQVTLARGSSVLAQGFYDVIVSNSEGRVRVTMQVVSGEVSTAMAMATTDNEDLLATGEGEGDAAPPSHPPPSPHTPSWRVALTVAMVVAAAAAVMVVMVVGAVFMWRRKRGNGTPDSKKPRPPHILTTELAASFRTGGEMSDVYIYPGLPSSPGYHTAAGMNTEAERVSAAHVYSEVVYYENSPHSHHGRGPEGREGGVYEGEGGVYEGLRMDDLHQPSLYSRLRP